MPAFADPTVARSLKRASHAGALVCLALGLLVLVGWAFDVTVLKRVHPSLAAMKANTAVGFVLLGSALVACHGLGASLRWSRRLGGALALLGTLTMAEYLFGWNLGIDELLMRDPHGLAAGHAPGRSAPASALAFMLLGFALVFIDVRVGEFARSPTQGLALLTLLVALLALLGYLYGEHGLYRIGEFVAFALHSALGLLVGSLALLFARPENGLMRFVVSQSPAGAMARRLLPATFAIPIALGWARLQGEKAGYYGASFGVAALVSGSIVGLTGFVWWSAAHLVTSDEARRAAETAERESAARAEKRFRVLALASEAFVDTNMALGPLLDRVARIVVEEFGDVCAVRLLSDDRTSLRLGALHHADPEGLALLRQLFTDHPEPLDAAPTGRVVLTGEPLLMPVVAQEEFRASLSPRFAPYLEEFEVHSVLSVPLRGGDAILGSISLSRTAPGRPYTLEDQALLVELGERAGLAVRTARSLEDLEAAVETRDDFLAAAGHELKTPLAAMLMQIQGLQRLTRRDPTASIGDRIDKVEHSGVRLERLIHQLLDVSVIRSGKLGMEPETFDLSELVREVAERFEAASEKARAPISVRGAQQVSGCWDRSRIDQVLTNLLSNAIKYGRGAPVEVEVSEDGGDVAVRVTDHGVGIDPEQQKKLFEKFGRAPATRDFGGFGLGLWISRQITEASGGKIEVVSAEGEGSAFTVRLPRQRPQEQVQVGEEHHGSE